MTAVAQRIVGLHELSYTADGPTRGHAHIGFTELPAGAPGQLDFDPLLLFAHGINRPGEGFAMHRHEGIENVLVMLEGHIEHADSLGNACVLEADDVALLSAGAGVEHAEHAVGETGAQALVIWIRTASPDAPAAFSRRSFAREQARGRWTVLASGWESGALPLRADAEIRRARLVAGEEIDHDVGMERRVYAIALGGNVEAAGVAVAAGERVLAEGGGTLTFRASTPVELVLVDMARG